jgi:hypothetical protein
VVHRDELEVERTDALLLPLVAPSEAELAPIRADLAEAGWVI